MKNGNSYIQNNISVANLDTNNLYFDKNETILEFEMRLLIDKIPDFSWQHKSSCYISFFLPEGKVVKAEGLDEVISLPYTNHNNYDTLFVGKEIGKNTDKTSRFIIAFEAKDHEELMQRREDIIRMIKVDVVGADGIVRGPIWE